MRQHYFAFFSIVLILSSVAFAQMDYSKIEMKSEKVAGTVHIITGTNEAEQFTGGNIAVSVGEDGVLMVDTKFAGLVEKITSVMKGIGNETPKYILNTHIHGDHTGGNALLNEVGTVIAHTNVRKRMQENKPEESWPVITFDKSLTFHMNGEDIQAMHHPSGHTDGDAVIFFKGSNIIHMGDLFFNGMFPFVDLNSGGNVQGYMDNIKKVMDSAPADVTIIPGHGPIATMDDLKAWHTMLQETTDYVRARMKDGKTLDQLKEISLPEKYSGFHWGFITTDKWIETIFNSYQ